jgi:hypothetical protein
MKWLQPVLSAAVVARDASGAALAAVTVSPSGCCRLNVLSLKEAVPQGSDHGVSSRTTAATCSSAEVVGLAGGSVRCRAQRHSAMS